MRPSSHLAPRLGALLLAVALGCATFRPRPVQLYDGAPSPASEIARIRIASPQALVVGVDDRSLEGPGRPYLSYSEAHVRPGRHTLRLLHVREQRLTPSVRALREARGELTFDAEAGHVYTVVVREVGESHVWFDIKDQGTDWDARCGALEGKHPMLVYAGEGVPPECF